MTEELTPDERKAMEQVAENCKFWRSHICKRETAEKYLRQKGVKDPSVIIDQLIRKGVLYGVRSYIGPTEPEKWGVQR